VADLPTDTTPLYDAVVAALSTHTGQTRCIAPEYLLREGKPSDLEKGARSGELGRPVFFVAPIEEAATDPGLIMTDRRRVDATVQIFVWYRAHPTHPAEFTAMRTRAAADKQRITDALTYPSALYVAPSGTRTGLDGGSLRTDGGRLVIEGPIPAVGFDQRVYRTSFRFRAGVEMTR
jgi:hypothetical protein